MELYDQIRKTSFVFFFLFGIVHFLAGLVFVNGYFPLQSGLINRILFIPFVVATLAYAYANLKHHLLELGKSPKWLDISLLSLGILIFVGLLALEFLVKDSPCPLSACL